LDIMLSVIRLNDEAPRESVCDEKIAHPLLRISSDPTQKGATTLIIMTFSITTFSIMKLGVMALNARLNITTLTMIDLDFLLLG